MSPAATLAPRRSGKRWSAEERAVMAALAQRGWSARQIADVLLRTRSAVALRLQWLSGGQA